MSVQEFLDQLSEVTRVELIDDKGYRSFSKIGVTVACLVIQDDGQTLKIVLAKREDAEECRRKWINALTADLRKATDYDVGMTENE